ncbi:potassium transporter [Solibacillus sp. FSL K6-4121]|uniref:potassium transporter n=1 Tax=Solibacillus sp. FSL K6-4121 TaxID=2921505 RepID=UPI0030FBBC2E
MNSITSSKNGTLLLVIAFAMALLFALYTFVIKPKQEEAQSIRTEINYMRTEISTLEQNLGDNQSQYSETDVNEFALRKKVPSDREIDTLILSIEEIEYVTGSQIRSIEFNNYDALVSDSAIQNPSVDEEQESLDGLLDDLESTEEEAPVSTIAVETLPPSLKLVTFIIGVTSPNDVNLLNFIKEIEQLERVMHIDRVEFELSGEEAELMADEPDAVTAEVQVTTFYYE